MRVFQSAFAVAVCALAVGCSGGASEPLTKEQVESLIVVTPD